MATFTVAEYQTYFEWGCLNLEAVGSLTGVLLTLENKGASTTVAPAAFDSVLIPANQTYCSDRYDSGDSSLLSFDPGDVFTVYCYRYTDKYYLVGSQTVYIPAIKLATPTYDSTGGVDYDSIAVYYDQVTGGDYYYIRAYKSDGTFVAEISDVDFVSGARVCATFNNLDPDTYYKFKCKCSSGYSYYDDSDWSGYSSTTKTNALVKLSIPSVSSYTEGSTSIGIVLNAVSNATSYSIDYYKLESGSYVYKGYKGQASTNFSFTGLDAGSEYKFVIVAEGTGGYTDSDPLTVYYETASARPSSFAWTYTKTQGGTFNLAAAEWNGLIDNIELVHIYKLGSYNSSSYPMTAAVKGNSFTASIFNQVRAAINAVNSTTNGAITAKSTGNAITAADLNMLVTKINAVT